MFWKRNLAFAPLFILLFALITFFVFFFIKSDKHNTTTIFKNETLPPTPTLTPTPSPLPIAYEIPSKTHVFQSFNNCGPATLSMALSYLGIDLSQEELGNALRPYQVASGDNDDKSVTLEEVANHAKTLGLRSYLRPNGSIEKIKQLTSQDIVVITRTWLKPNEDIGHYRIVRGYDDATSEIIQDDSLQGKNLRYSYLEFESMWQPFNYEYLVIVDDSKKEIVEKILSEDLDDQNAWRNAEKVISSKLSTDPSNIHLRFALSRIYYYLSQYQKSVDEFNKVENDLSFRTLWYQIEPIKAIYETDDYERLFNITDRILAHQNSAFSELYILRGKAYLAQENKDAARAEFEKAVYYNSNLQEAKDLLQGLN